MFDLIVLYACYSHSDEKVDCQVCDRLSVMRVLGLEDRVPKQRNRREENAPITAGGKSGPRFESGSGAGPDHP